VDNSFGEGKMKITNITVLISTGVDKVCLHTDIAEPCWPNKGFCTLMAFAPQEGGEKFARENFPDVEIKVMDLRT